jgi:uncharacterized protein YecE (DUF72 family)
MHRPLAGYGPAMPASPKTEKAPTALGPVIRIGGSRIRTGTCSWTDPTLLKETDWYPKRTMSAADRLAYYAERFPLVEADSTYYRPPGEQLTRGWAQHTPSGFAMNVKAYSLFTHHPTQPQSLWPDLHEGIKPEFVGKRRLYAEHLDPDALDEAWDRFAHALGPLRRAGKLGAVLMQYPTWFTPKRANRQELEKLAARLPNTRICVEFRSPRWLAADDRESTIDLLRGCDLALVVVDAPTVSGLDTVAAVTCEDLAVVRFHGRANEAWKARDATAAERFRYLYSDDELRGWSPDIRHLADEASEVHVLMNNCYQDYGVRNAADMQRLLHDLE